MYTQLALHEIEQKTLSSPSILGMLDRQLDDIHSSKHQCTEQQTLHLLVIKERTTLCWTNYVY